MQNLGVSNIEASGYSEFSRTLAVGWERGGFRFHVWVDKETGKLRDENIYKNPPLEIKHGQPGWFSTLHLRASAKVNRPILEYVLGEVRAGDMIQKAKAAFDATVAEHEAQAKARQDLERIKEAGPALLRALKRWQRFGRDNGWDDANFHDADGTGWVSDTDAAIALAEGR